MDRYVLALSLLLEFWRIFDAAPSYENDLAESVEAFTEFLYLEASTLKLAYGLG